MGETFVPPFLGKFPMITFNKMTNYATEGTYKYEIRVSVSFARNKHNMLLFSTEVGLRPLCASEIFIISTTHATARYIRLCNGIFQRGFVSEKTMRMLAATAPMRAQRVNGSTVTSKSTCSPFSVSNISVQEYSWSEFSTISADFHS